VTTVRLCSLGIYVLHVPLSVISGSKYNKFLWHKTQNLFMKTPQNNILSTRQLHVDQNLLTTAAKTISQLLFSARQYDAFARPSVRPPVCPSATRVDHPKTVDFHHTVANPSGFCGIGLPNH